MTYREVGAPEWTVLALQQPLFQRTFIHAIDQVEGPRSELNGIIAALLAGAASIVAIGVRCRCEGGEYSKGRRKYGRPHDIAHENLPVWSARGAPCTPALMLDSARCNPSK